MIHGRQATGSIYQSRLISGRPPVRQARHGRLRDSISQRGAISLSRRPPFELGQ